MAQRRALLLKMVAIPAVLLCVQGCAHGPGPKEKLREPERAIAEALDAGAARHAPDELARAKRKLALAKRWLENADPDVTGWLLQQAEVDAELARIKASAQPIRAARQ